MMTLLPQHLPKEQETYPKILMKQMISDKRIQSQTNTSVKMNQ